jgi:excisionase family DNA binding protein
MITTDSISPTGQRQAGSPWPLSDAAKYLGVSHRHLVRLIDAGKVKSIRLGRRVLIADAELQRVANEGIQ